MWIQSFVDCLEGSTLAHPRIDEALAIKQHHVPGRIYKYRRDCCCSRENLKTDTVWISSPDSYNDPYDCAFTVSEGRVVAAAMRGLVDTFVTTYKLQDIISAEEIEKAKGSKYPMEAVAECISARVSSAPGRNAQQMAELSSITLPKFVGNAVSFLHQVRKATKVCSFSSISNSILMWSHYADNHCGFCIEYDLEPLTAEHTFRKSLYPVIYSQKLYDLTQWAELLMGPDRQQFNTISPLLGTIHKYAGWRCEKEWRLVMIEDKPTESRNWKVPTPSRVLLGSQMKDSSKDEVAAICRAKNIEVWQMCLANDRFELLAKPRN